MLDELQVTKTNAGGRLYDERAMADALPAALEQALGDFFFPSYPIYARRVSEVESESVKKMNEISVKLTTQSRLLEAGMSEIVDREFWKLLA